MGMFKQFKDVVGVVNEMPAVVQQANALQAQAAQAQAMRARTDTHYTAGVYGTMPQSADLADGDARLAPIEGITLQRYAEVSKVAATRGLDQVGLAEYVRSRGYDPQAWARAAEGWNARFRGDMQLATHFGRLYTEAQV
jgi:hypothetical protein